MNNKDLQPSQIDPFTYIESTIKTNITQFSTQITSEIVSLYNETKLLKDKHTDISSQLMEHKIRLDKIDHLSSLLSQTNEQLAIINIRISNLNKDLSKAQMKYDKIFLDNLTVPGYIGEYSQYKTLREYIEDNINQVNKLIKDKDKNENELKAYRDKIEQLTNQCTQSMTNFTKTYMSYNNTIKTECSAYVDTKYEHVMDMIHNLKIANGSEGLKIRQKADELKKEIGDLKELREMIEGSVINEMKECNNKIIFIEKQIEECKGEIGEIKRKGVNSKYGGNNGNSPMRRVIFSSISPRGEKDKKREMSPIVRGGRSSYQRSVEFEKPVLNISKGNGMGNSMNVKCNSVLTNSKDELSDSFGIMKSKGITIIKEEDKVLNISNINSLPDIKDTSIKDKQLICKQQLSNNTQHQTRQTSPQCITTNNNMHHDTTMSPPFQTTSKLLNKQRSIIFQRERQPNSTQQTTPSIATTIDKATSTIYPHSSLPFNHSSTNSYKNIRSITTSKQKVIEHISTKHKIINLQFTGKDASNIVNPSFYDYSNNNTLNSTRPFSTNTHRKRQSFKEFIESNINVNTHKHQLHKQRSQGIKTQIDCVPSNKIKSHKQKNKFINAIHTHSNIQKGNH